MHSRSRRIVTAAVIAGGLTLFASPVSYAASDKAFTDPTAMFICLGNAVSESSSKANPVPILGGRNGHGTMPGLPTACVTNPNPH